MNKIGDPRNNKAGIHRQAGFSVTIIPEGKINVLRDDTIEKYLSAIYKSNTDIHLFDFGRLKWGKLEVIKSSNLKVGETIIHIPTYLFYQEKMKEQTRAKLIKSFNIVERRSWGKMTPIYAKHEADWNYTAIAVHHSGNSGMDVPAAVEQTHMGKNAWSDVGYHYLIAPNGTVYEGTSLLVKGGHLRKKNTGIIGILLMGDYDEQWWDIDDELSKKQLVIFKDLVKALKSHFQIDKLGGHKEYLPGQGYTCPGNLLMDKMNLFRKELQLSAP